MNVIYVANIRMPTEKAHGVQIMKMCEAFAGEGIDVELVVTNRKTHIKEDPFEYYNVSRSFPITFLSVPDTVGWGKIGFLFESVFFGVRAGLYARQNKSDIVYGRDEIPLWIVSRMAQAPIAWESHTGAWNWFSRALARRAKRIITISGGLKSFYAEKGVSEDKIIIAHDAVDLDQFLQTESKEQARKRLGLPLDRKIAMYVGRLDGWKGTDTLMEASGMISDEVDVVMIGGEPDQIKALQSAHPHISFLGYRPYRELADNLAAADVLVLPNTGEDEVSTWFTSPLKLFAYMAAVRPIVVSDLPSIREVVSEDEVFFVQPDDPDALAEEIIRVFEDSALAEEKARCARERVQEHTWQKRAEKIINFLKLI